jgi:hypothetical protein
MGAVLVEPGVEVEVVVLLAPQHAGERLAKHQPRIGVDAGDSNAV